MTVRLWTRAEVLRYAEGAVDLYRENVRRHGMADAAAAAATAIDTSEALDYDEELAADEAELPAEVE
jgi:hypothetical protein